MIHGAFQKKFGLLLRSLVFQALNLVLRKNSGRGRFWLTLESQKPADLLECRFGISSGKEYGQEDSRSHREQDAPATSPGSMDWSSFIFERRPYGAVLLHRLRLRISLP